MHFQERKIIKIEQYSKLWLLKFVRIPAKKFREMIIR